MNSIIQNPINTVTTLYPLQTSSLEGSGNVTVGSGISYGGQQNQEVIQDTVEISSEAYALSEEGGDGFSTLPTGVSPDSTIEINESGVPLGEGDISPELFAGPLVPEPMDLDPPHG